MSYCIEAGWDLFMSGCAVGFIFALVVAGFIPSISEKMKRKKK